MDDTKGLGDTKLLTAEHVATYRANDINFDGKHAHKAVGPQPFFSGPKGKVSPSRVEYFKPPLPEPKPLGMTPRDENERKSDQKWKEGTMETARHTAQKFNVKLLGEAHNAAIQAQYKGATQRRQAVLTNAWQQASEKDDRAQLLLGAGVKTGNVKGTPRRREGPKDAKAPSPREVTARWTPVEKAITAGREEVALKEATLRKEYATLVRANEASGAASARDRRSKQDELGTQAGNLSARRDDVDHMRANAALKIDSHQKAQVKARETARAGADSLQKKILELRAKKEAARREAWLLQAHPPAPTSPRWNEDSKQVAKRGVERTAVAKDAPKPQAGYMR